RAALRNFFQQTSEPCRSVAKNTFGILLLSLDQYFSDLALESCDVPAHDVVGAGPVAGEDGPQQLDVLVHRLEQPHLAVQHEVPQAEAEVEVALQRCLEEGVVRAAVDQPVN